MSEEAKTPAKENLMFDANAYASARTMYVQNAAFARTQEEVLIMLGHNAPYKVNQDEVETHPFLVDTVCFFTIDHFRRFAVRIARELAELDRMLADQSEE